MTFPDHMDEPRPYTDEEMGEYRPGGRLKDRCERPERWLATADNAREALRQRIRERIELLDKPGSPGDRAWKRRVVDELKGLLR